MKQIEARVPPNNVDAEQAALGSMMLSKTALHKGQSILQVTDFYRPVHEDIFEAVCALGANKQPTDVVTMMEELRRRGKLEDCGGVEYLMALVESVPTAAHIEHYSNIVAKLSRLRQCITAGTAVVAAAYAEDETAPELMIQKAVEISGQAHGSRVRKSGDIINSVWTRFEDYKEGKRRMGIPFGIKELDAMTYGCCPGELILIGGRPSYGKSVLLAHVLLGAAKSGKTPLLFSNEMTSEDFGERLCNMEARVDANKSRGGKLDAEEWDRLATAHAELSNMNFLIDDMPCPLTKLCARARSAAISDNIGIILIDYIQLIECDTKTTNRDGQIETVARTLKQLALELNIPVVTPSQFSRAVEKRDDKRPLLSDLRDGGNQEGHADKVLLLDNPLPKDHQIGEALEQRRCRVYVAKHRGGRIGEVPLWFTPYYTRFDGEVTE